MVYGLLAGLWVLVVAWQVEEHVRSQESGKTALRNRSKSIASTLGASIRGMQFRGALFGDKVQPVLNELVNAQTNEVGMSSEVVAVQLLNLAGEPLASAGRAITNLDQKEIVQEGERWGPRTVTFVYPIAGATVSQEGGTNMPGPVLLPPFTNSMREGRFSRRDNRSEEQRGSNSGSGPSSSMR